MRTSKVNERPGQGAFQREVCGMKIERTGGDGRSVVGVCNTKTKERERESGRKRECGGMARVRKGV